MIEISWGKYIQYYDIKLLEYLNWNRFIEIRLRLHHKHFSNHFIWDNLAKANLLPNQAMYEALGRLEMLSFVLSLSGFLDYKVCKKVAFSQNFADVFIP